MIVKPTRNRAEIEKILKHPEIYERITQDAAPDLKDYRVKIPKNTIFLTDSQNKVGVMIFDPLGPVCYDCHIHVLKDKRDKALAFAHACFNYLWKHTDAIKITAQIALYFPDVIKFAAKCGFEIEGINTRSFVKKGQIYDQVYMGLMR